MKPTPARKFSTSSTRNSRNGWARNGWSSCRRCWPRRQPPFRRANQPHRHHAADPNPASGTVGCCPAAAAPHSQTYLCGRTTRGRQRGRARHPEQNNLQAAIRAARTAQLERLDELIVPLAGARAPRLLALHGIGPDTAALLLIAAGDHPERLRSEAAWAHMCAVAPIPASSGKVRRHRLNPGGNREANHALRRIVITRLNGLRVSEATGADIEQLGLERGHRTLVITRKGGKVVTIPLAPRTARAIDLAVGERTEGPIFLAGDGRRLDRHGAARIVGRVTRGAGIAKHISPHTLRHAFITAALDAGVPLRDVQEAASHADPRTTMRYDRARTSLDRHATYIVAAFIAGAAR
jgi:integrase